MTLVLLVVGALYAGWQRLTGDVAPDAGPRPPATESAAPPTTGSAPGTAAGGATARDDIASAFRDRRSDVQVSGAGVVARVLADDRDGSRHQRFTLRLPSGQTVLVAHNIDLAPRVAPLRVGDTVSFSGEYEWNAQGGVLHWTHRDPDGRHPGGWLRRRGETFR